VNAWCTHPFLDIVIRTGGEKRLSGFLPMHTAYAELFFLDKMAPELTVEDIAGTMQEYDQRRKPYGR
jgi:undecaprenyl diphosphate synthase